MADLNLGLVDEDNEDISNALQHMDEAFDTRSEASDSDTSRKNGPEDDEASMSSVSEASSPGRGQSPPQEKRKPVRAPKSSKVKETKRKSTDNEAKEVVGKDSVDGVSVAAKKKSASQENKNRKRPITTATSGNGDSAKTAKRKVSAVKKGSGTDSEDEGDEEEGKALGGDDADKRNNGKKDQGSRKKTVTTSNNNNNNKDTKSDDDEMTRRESARV